MSGTLCVLLYVRCFIWMLNTLDKVQYGSFIAKEPNILACPLKQTNLKALMYEYFFILQTFLMLIHPFFICRLHRRIYFFRPIIYLTLYTLTAQ